MESSSDERSYIGLDQLALAALQPALHQSEPNHSPIVPRSRAPEYQISQASHITLSFDGITPFITGQEDHGAIAATSPGLLSLSTSAYDEYTHDPRFLESQRKLRDLLLTSAQSLAPTRAGSPIDTAAIPSEGSQGKQNSRLKDIITTEERVVWLKNYLDEVAPWLDMFDEEQHFQTKIPILAQSSVPLTYAMLAISARQIERGRKLNGDHDSLQLYQESIKSLTPQLLAQDPNIMAACVILCVLEMMSASPWNWRRHLDGCAALFSSHGITGNSGGIRQAVFWCYARMDLCAAIISAGEESVVLPLEHWLPQGIVPCNVFQTNKVPDMWANYAVYLGGQVCHLIWLQCNDSIDTSTPTDDEAFLHKWHQLWSDLQAWLAERPPELLQLEFREDTMKDNLFPFILYAAPCAISSNQLYHTSCLLLLDIFPPSVNPSQLGQIGSKLWHARRICGISTTNAHHGCLNNAIQPLWVAGKVLSHPVEHKAVADLIRSIEAKTGWGGKWRIADLKEVWGYDRDAAV
ncbi:C6 zinc finger domain-containing protein [Amylocarpus encephaloides]|uniref:C6 zinc finger domain-containing protein n=1 Tax=Amylocarpus encephaloides TaxID=45428 RepID=A0A9P7YLD9_9HELO|nr:C6 zinc finger domain-containing protein [Amylocarpus encephaloides]